MMNITFKGSKINIEGKELKVGDKAPDFNLTNNSLENVSLSDTKGKRIFVVVPSVDTPVCDREVRRFNEEASKLECTTSEESCDIMDKNFPIEDALISPLIELVVKELSGAIYKPKDDENNASDDLANLATFLRRNVKSDL